MVDLHEGDYCPLCLKSKHHGPPHAVMVGKKVRFVLKPAEVKSFLAYFYKVEGHAQDSGYNTGRRWNDLHAEDFHEKLMEVEKAKGPQTVTVDPKEVEGFMVYFYYVESLSQGEGYSVDFIDRASSTQSRIMAAEEVAGVDAHAKAVELKLVGE